MPDEKWWFANPAILSNCFGLVPDMSKLSKHQLQYLYFFMVSIQKILPDSNSNFLNLGIDRYQYVITYSTN